MKKFLLLFLLIGFASSCRHLPVDPSDPNDPGGPRDTTKPVVQPLAGTEWELEPMPGTHRPEEIYTLAFSSDTQAGGQAACNSYGAEYKTDRNAIAFSRLISTKAYCGDGSFNDEYYGLLSRAKSYTVDNDRLVIACGSDREIRADGTIGVRYLTYSRIRNGNSGNHGAGAQYKPLVEWVDFSVVRFANDRFRIIKTERTDDTHIAVTVEYGGGCAPHAFRMFADKGFSISEEKMDINLMLVHESNGDLCNALLTETLVFDISPLVREWQGGYCAGNLNMHITGSSNSDEMVFRK